MTTLCKCDRCNEVKATNHAYRVKLSAESFGPPPIGSRGREEAELCQDCYARLVKNYFTSPALDPNHD